MPSGGPRPGAGRPKKGSKPPADPAASRRYDDPLSYLIAVSTGEVQADALRIAAAKAALPYTAPKARAPVESPPPRKLRNQNQRDTEADAQAAWRRKAEAIRKKHEGKSNG